MVFNVNLSDSTYIFRRALLEVRPGRGDVQGHLQPNFKITTLSWVAPIRERAHLRSLSLGQTAQLDRLDFEGIYV